MSDPRWSDPRYNDPPLDPILRRNESVGGVWGWIAGLAVLGLIAFMIVAGWNGNSNTANDNTPPSISHRQHATHRHAAEHHRRRLDVAAANRAPARTGQSRRAVKRSACERCVHGPGAKRRRVPVSASAR